MLEVVTDAPAWLAYGSLALSAFLGATVLPGQSEVVLVTLMAAGWPVWSLILVASAANVIGSMVNWWLGRNLVRFQDKRWFPVNPQQLQRAESWYQRYGWWLLLFAWVPLLGDSITLIAGVFRERLWRFVLLVTIAKTSRYLVVAGLTNLAL